MAELTESQKKAFASKRGMNTKEWGPKLWDSLFIMTLGAFPVKICKSNKVHLRTQKAFCNLMFNLRYTLPCSFCRESYKHFYKEIPISKFCDTRVSMVYWLYLMKDKVNQKLIEQEKEYTSDINMKLSSKKISKTDHLKLRKKCFKTVKSPKFLEVIKRYEKFRANCNKKLKKCVK